MLSRALLTIPLLVLGAGIGLAGNGYYNGYVNSDGYTYQDGYWAYNGSYYTRTLYESYGYWRCGVYYPGSRYYTYAVANYTPPAAATVATPSYKPGWREALLEVAAQRDRLRAEALKNVIDQNAYIESVKALGLDGEFRWPGLGAIPSHLLSTPSFQSSLPYGSHGNVYNTTTYGANATSQYGISYATLANVYGDNSLPLLYQAMAQAVSGAQRLAGDANSGLQSVVNQEGANRARIAEIITRAQMAEKIIAALQSPGGVSTTGFTFSIGPGGNLTRSEGVIDNATREQINTQWQASAQRCMVCHSPAKKSGGFDVTTYPNLDVEAKNKVWARLTSPDDKIRMPRLPGGGVDKPLPQEELKLWLLR
jgi:hypothetical protein